MTGKLTSGEHSTDVNVTLYQVFVNVCRGAN